LGELTRPLTGFKGPEEPKGRGKGRERKRKRLGRRGARKEGRKIGEKKILKNNNDKTNSELQADNC